MLNTYLSVISQPESPKCIFLFSREEALIIDLASGAILNSTIGELHDPVQRINLERS